MKEKYRCEGQNKERNGSRRLRSIFGERGRGVGVRGEEKEVEGK